MGSACLGEVLSGDNRMIIVKFTGGLGNQMYQYALLCMLKKRYPDVDVMADISMYYALDLHYGFELDSIFSLSERGKLQIATNKQLYQGRREIPFWGGTIGKMMQIPVSWLNARIRPGAERKGLRNVICEESMSWNGDVEKLDYALRHLDIEKNWYLDGYWQKEEYFAEVLPELITNCKFPELNTEQERNMCQRIAEINSVSVHIRRGDYVNSKYDILGTEYYRKAIDYMSDHVEQPVFFFFSEDEHFIEENYTWLPNKVIVSFNKGKNSYRDMQLMSLCKHNIVANSSFSNWAGYLNKNSNKIVVYPKQYTTTEENGTKKGWVRLDV